MIHNRILSISKIAFRNFRRNTSRYRLLIVALSAAVTVQVIILGVVLGMSSTLQDKAARYFGGDISILGYGEGAFSQIAQPDELERAIRESSVGVNYTSRRSNYYKDDFTLFYEGNSQKQRRMIGVDWEHEQETLRSFVLTDGVVPDGLSPEDDQAILISSTTAASLNTQLGDRVTIRLTTDNGQQNTGRFIVTAIFDDPSFFGYSTYISRSALNALTGKDPEHVSEIGVFLNNGVSQRTAAKRINHAISMSLPTYEQVFTTQDQRNVAFRSRDENTQRFYGVITLEANLAEINNLLDALALVAAFLIGLFLLIVIFGVGNTYKMVVYERTREIGTMRAVGLTKGLTLGMFLFESLYLGIFSSIVGFLLGLLSLHGISRIDFSRQEAFLIFLSQGRIQWNLTLAWVVVIVIIIAGASIIGGMGSARKAANLAPADALRSE